MDGTKPKQQRDKPVDKQNKNLKEKFSELQEKLDAPKQEQDKSVFDGWRLHTPDRKPTKKYVSKAHVKKRRKIARKSKQVNRKRNKR